MQRSNSFVRIKTIGLFFLSSTILLTSCGSTGNLEQTTPPSSPTSTESNTININTENCSLLAADIKSKYKDFYPYKLDPTIHYLNRNEILEVELPFNMSHDHNTYDFFQFFLDPDLKIPLWRPAPDDYYVGYNKVKIHPKSYPLFSTESENEEAVGENANWGNAGTLYLAKYYDANGNILDEPQEVSVIKIKTELAKPLVKVATNEDGLATLSWHPVPHATQYSVYKISLIDGETTGDELLMFHGSTDETSYSDFEVFSHDFSNITGRETNGVISINDEFQSEDNNALNAYVVRAENDHGKSEMSNIIYPADYAYMLPNCLDYDAIDQQELDSTLSLPYYSPIKMCDGSTVYYFSYIEGKEAPDQLLSQFLKRQKEATTRAAGLNDSHSLNITTDTEDLPTPSEAAPSDSANTLTLDGLEDYTISATNPLSEYLAYNLLCCNTNISLEDFPEASDASYLEDALWEAIYQNPLIDHYDKAYIVPSTTSLIVQYSRAYDDERSRQKDLMQTAHQIIDTIITSDMTDLDKELAINQYLCDNITYDQEALDSAAANDYWYWPCLEQSQT